MQFLRVNPENGRLRPLSPEAFNFWQAHGAVIAGLLRPETPLTLAAIVEAYADYQLEHPEGGVAVDDAYVAWVLLELADYELVQIVLPAGASQRPRRRPSVLNHQQ